MSAKGTGISPGDFFQGRLFPVSLQENTFLLGGLFHVDCLDLMEPAGLRKVLENLAAVTGMAMALVDERGRLLGGKNNLPLCSLINGTHEGRLACEAFRIGLAQAALGSGRVEKQVCHAGLVYLAAPVAVTDNAAVVLLGGNVALRPPAEEALVRLARETGLDLGKLQAAAGVIPVWPEERLRAAMALVQTATDTVGRLLYARQELQRKVEELTALFEFTRKVSGSLQVTEVARQALEAVLGLTGATSGSVVMLNEVMPGVTVGETAATLASCNEFRVVPAGEIVAVVEREARAAHFDSRPEGRTPEERRPAVAIPLTVGGKVTGVLTIAGRPEGARFTKDETVFLTTLGTSLGLALENARLFRQLQARATMLERLIEVGQVVSSSLDVDLVLESALANVRDVLGAQWCALRLLDEETGELVLKASLGMSAELQARAGRIRPDDTLLGKVLQTGEPVVIGDLTAGGIGPHMPYYAAEMQAVAVVPVKVGGKILGTLKVYSPVPRRWSEEEVGYLAIIASQTGLALENARLYSSLQEYYSSTVQALAAALDAKDVYTRGHSVRVAKWARACARMLGLGAGEQEQVYLAGLLHDLGKIGVRESILLKPGPLTAEERKEMQSHPGVGARILEPAKFPDAVIAAVRHHHEDYDGGGYPDGLAGEEIPLLARIIRVADTYDAMMSARPYRQALTPRQAREELRRWAGRQFDPRVVEAFLQLPGKEIEDIAGVEDCGNATGGGDGSHVLPGWRSRM